MSFKAASQATLTFISARKRIEDGLKNWTKRRISKRDALEGMGLWVNTLITNGKIIGRYPKTLL